MSKFVVLDAEGRPTAFYSEDLHGPREIAQQTKAEEKDAEGKVTAAAEFAQVANPATKIPAAAVPITDDQYDELMHNGGSLKGLVDGQVVDVAARRPAAVTAAFVGSRCIKLLIASDWTQAPDNPLPSKAAWTAYRAQLWQILAASSQKGFDPSSVVYPTTPA